MADDTTRIVNSNKRFGNVGINGHDSSNLALPALRGQGRVSLKEGSGRKSEGAVANHSLSSAKPSDASNQRNSKKEARPSSAQHPIKVLISDACIHKGTAQDTANSTQIQGKELDLEHGSPLVLTHQINLVPGSCGGCEVEFATLRERLEHLEKEVSTLKGKCMDAEGAACSLHSDGNECPNDCSDQGRCEGGKCVCFPGYNGHDCSSAACQSDCNNNGKCVNDQCVCDDGYSGPDCADKSCPEHSAYHITLNSQREGDKKITAKVGGRLSSFTQTGLAAGQKYKVSIRGERAGKMGPESTTEFTTAPSNSLDLQSRDITDSSVTVFWNLPSVQYSAYHITFNSQREGDEKITAKVGGRLSSFTQTGLAAGQKYKVSIRGERTGKMGAESTTEFTTAPSDSLDLQSRDITDSSVTVFWNLPSVQYSAYHITFNSQREGDEKITAKVGGRLSSFTQTGLAAGQKYKVSIRGERAGKMGPESTTEFTTASSTSLLLRSRDITDSSVTLFWTLPSVPYNTYHITFNSQKEGDEKITAKVGGRLSSFTQTGLAAGQKYKVSIRGERAGKMGPESTIEFTTSLSSSLQLQSRDITDSSATLFWTLPSVAYSTYHIAFKSQKEGDEKITAKVGGKLSSFTQTGLVAGQKYKVGIRGERAGKMGPESTTEFTTALSSSLQLQSRDITDSSVTLFWTLPSVPYNTYHITFKGQREGDEKITAKVGGRLSSFTQTGLAAGQKYKVSIRGETAGKMSIRGERAGKMGPESSTEFTTASSTSPQLRSRDITDSSVTLFWTLPSVPYNTYHITFKSQREGDEKITAKVGGRISSFTQTGLAAGQKYKVSIRGERAGKMGPESTTEFTTALSSSLHLQSKDITDSSVTLFWTLPSVQYSAYHITFKNQKEGDEKITAKVGGRLSSFTQTGLAAGLKYKVSIKGERAGKMGPESTTEFTTALSSSVQLRSRDITDSSVTLFWTLPSVPYNTYHITFKGQYKVSIRGERAGKMGPESTTEFTTASSTSLQLRSRGITDSSVTLFWTLPSVPYSTHHITFKSQREGDEKITAKVGGRLSSFTQTGLAAGQKYKVSIRGERAGKMGPESTTEFTTYIAGPRNFYILKTTRTSVLVQWDSPMGKIDSYHLTISPNLRNEGKKESQETTLPPDTDAAKIDGLEEGRLYDIILVAQKGKSRSQPIRVQAKPGNGKSIFTKEIVETVTTKVPPEGEMIKEKKKTEKAKLDKTLFVKKDEEGQRKELQEKSFRREGDSSTIKQGTYVKTDITSSHRKEKTVVGSDAVILRKTSAGPESRMTAQGGKKMSQPSQKQAATRGQKESTKVTQPNTRLGSKHQPKAHPTPETTVTAKQNLVDRTHTETDNNKASPQPLHPNVTQTSSNLKQSKPASKYLTHSGKEVSSNRTQSIKEVPEQISLAEENAAKTPRTKSTKKVVGHGKAHGSTSGLLTNSTALKGNTKSPTTKVELTKSDKAIGNRDNQVTGSRKTGVPPVNGTDSIHESLGNVTARYNTGSGKAGLGNRTDQTHAVKQRVDSSQNVTGILRTASVTERGSGPALGEKRGVLKTGGAAQANHTVLQKEREKGQGKILTNREGAAKKKENSAKKVTQTGNLVKTEFSHTITTVQVMQGQSEARGPGAGGTRTVTVRNDTSIIRQGTQGMQNNYSDTIQTETDTEIRSNAQVNRNHSSSSKMRHIYTKMGHNDTSYSHTDLNATMGPPSHSKNTTETNITTSSSTRNTGSALNSVKVLNVTSRGFSLIWEAPRGMFQNFVVTRKEYVPGSGEEGEGDEEEEETEEEEEEERSEVRVSGSQEGGKKGDNDPSIVSRNITDSHRKSSEGSSKHQSPTKSHSSTTVRVSGKNIKKISQVVPGNARSLTFRNLQPHTRYSLTLFGMGPGLQSKIHHFTITTGPESPSELLFSNVTDSALSVSWTKPKSPVSGFKITYTHTENEESFSALVDSQYSSVTLSQLSPGSSYDVSVTSVLGLEESDPIKGLVITVPDPPTDLQVGNVTDTKALLLWKRALATVDWYIIVYGSENVPDMTVKVTGNTAEHQLKGLHSGTIYTVTVTSQLDSQQSTRTTTTFTTAGESGITGEGLQELTASQVTPRSVVLSWKSPIMGVTSYKLTYQRAGQETKEVIIASTVTKFKLTGLSPLSKYTVWVQGERRGQYITAISTEFTTGSLRFPYPTDCSQELLNGMHQSGEVEVFPSGKLGRPVRVYCDMETDGGGWTVLQRRMNGDTNFFRGWTDYSYGFGNLSGEFWLGNELIHSFCSLRPMALRVDLRAGAESAYAYYSFFYVEGHRRHYALRVSGYSGTAGDSMRYHNGRPFSTRDKDPNPFITRCATSYRGGWWYKNCHEANLNGLYNTSTSHQGVIWTDWKGKDFSIPFTEMKLRPTSFPSRTQS
ncbi:hypothetical protein AAFF_G00250110 [Aldrovandia affinis]|uniref:Tenascin n=1 Tax=Aldrovandia affinis TaxID=143900 RepID=A0AAD7W3F0_9TELE|nr:hypothetical protein AAFF_G00250110 [Aldrovandia affinis]